MKKEGKIDKKNWQRALLILMTIVIILLIFIIFFANSSYKNYHSFRNHKNYFKNSTLQIEPWMTPSTILRHFNITSEDLFNTLNITNSSLNFKKQISSICLGKKENCTFVIEELNSKLQ